MSLVLLITLCLAVFAFRRVEALGTLLLALAAIMCLWLLGGVAVPLEYHVLVELLGLHALTLALLIAVLGCTIRFGRPARFKRPRVLSGVAFSVVATAGLLAFAAPDWTVGEVSTAETGAGGRVGAFLGGRWPGLAVWIATALALVPLAWPQAPAHTLRLASRAPGTLRRAAATAVELACPIDPAPDEVPGPWEPPPAPQADDEEDLTPVGASSGGRA